MSRTRLTERHAKIIRQMMVNAPGGCDTAHVVLLVIGPQATPADHRRIYRQLRQMKRANLVTGEGGFWTLNFARSLTNRQRYYLHSKIKDFYRVHARQRMIEYDPATKVPPMVSVYIDRLRRIGYNIQTFIK